MTIGAGKYDDACTDARVITEAAGAALIIFGGRFGNGFSVQGPAEFLLTLPKVLRYMADQIEHDNAQPDFAADPPPVV